MKLFRIVRNEYWNEYGQLLILIAEKDGLMLH